MKNLILSAIIILILSLPVLPALARDILPFQPDDTLEEIRYKIDHNGYDFTVSDNPIFSLSPEEKSRFFSRHASILPRRSVQTTGIGPLAERLGTVDPPEEFDWRDYNGHSYIGPIRDQGGCGSCYAF
ncbi:MAG: C1 family peptidase, partial [Candidatus Auribacterota bacterium]|nr:C1 family peptidase [Candidatus Auribacterota bacterium]